MRLATTSAWGLCIYWRAAQALATQESAVNIPSVPSPDLFTSEHPSNPQPNNVSAPLNEPCHLEALTSREFNITVEVGGDKLLFQWEAGQDLWALARQFRQGRRLMVPPDCLSKTTMADLESCVDNHLYMFMQREMMTRELQARSEAGRQTCAAGLYDYEALFRGTGGQYSHFDNYVFFRGVLERHASLLPTAVAMLRQCAETEPGFAPTIHTLTNALHDLYSHTRDEALRIEAQQWLHRSLALSTAAQPPVPAPSPLRCPALSADAPPMVRVVSVASHERPALSKLRRSVQAAGHTLTVLGLGLPWTGLGSKIVLLRDYLDSLGPQNECDLLVFVDAYDVTFLPPAAGLVARYAEALGMGPSGIIGGKREEEPILFSAETACSPDQGMQVLYEEKERQEGRRGAADQVSASFREGSGLAEEWGVGQEEGGERGGVRAHNHSLPLRFLNSGTYMGRVGLIKRMLDAVSKDLWHSHGYSGADTLELDDQRWFTRWYLASPPDSAVLDTQGLVFHTLYQLSLDDFEIGEKPGTLRSRVTGSFPSILHGNGGAFREVFGRLEEQGWPPVDISGGQAVQCV